MRRRKWMVLVALVLPLHQAVAQTVTSATQAISLKPMALLVVQLGVLVFAARVCGALFKRWRFSSVTGELLAGVLVGPYLFGGVALPGFPQGLMHGVPRILTGTHPLFGVVLVSLTVLLFLIGLDTDVGLIRRYKAASALVGIVGSAVSFVAICTVIVVASPWLFATDRPLAWYEPGPFFAAVAAGVTSVSILARMLADTRRLETPEGVVALSGAVMDGVVGMLLLAVGAGLVERVAAGQSVSLMVVVAGMLRAVLTVAILALLGLGVARKMARMALLERRCDGMFVGTAACVLVAAGVTGVCGQSPLLGAYVMGVVFSTTDLRHRIQERIECVSEALVPACFALVGSHVDLNMLADSRTALFVVGFVVVALLSKLIGCGITASWAGLTTVGGLRVGIVSMPRGEVTLALVMLALTAGVLPGPLLTAVVALLAVSGMVLPKLAETVFRRGGSGYRKGFVADEQVRLDFTLATAEGASLVARRVADVLEDDGFSIHVLNRRERFYRFTRDTLVVAVQQVGTILSFTCTPREHKLINTVMVEVAASIEQNLREVRQALDPRALQHKLQSAPGPGGDGRFSECILRACLLPETLRPRLLADTKTGVIEELLDLLYENDLITDRHAARRAVFAREQSLSTGLEHGLAIPHGRTDAVDRLVCAIGLKPDGIDFDSMDGQPSRIIILVLAPQGVSAPQLQLISMLSQMLNEQGRASLLTCDTAEEMYGVLTSGSGSTTARKGRLQPALSCLHWQNVSLDIGTGTKEEIIDRLLALCHRSGAVISPDEARAALLAREHKMSTGMEHGVALPHARTEAVSRLVCAVGISREGVDFDSLDGTPTRILVMTLIPPSVSTEYTRLAGAVMRALDREGRAALFTARSAAEALEVLARGEL